MVGEINERVRCDGGAPIDNLVAGMEEGKRSFLIHRAAPDGKSYATDIAQKYGLSFDISEEEYEKLEDGKKQIYDEANKAFLKDPRTGTAFRNLLVLAITNVGVSLLVADVIIYFIVPLLLKNGQTLGKKCFGLAVIRTNGVKITPPVLLIRSIIGQFAMETIVPLTIVAMMLLGSLGFVGTISLVLFAVLEIGVMIYTKTNSSIHDLLTDSVVVDMSSQQIFETQEERTEYDKAEAARKAAEQEGEKVIATGIFAPRTQPAQPVQAPQSVQPQTQAVSAEIVATPITAEPVAAELAEVAEMAEQPQAVTPAPMENTVAQSETPTENAPSKTTNTTQTEQADEAPVPQTAQEENAENSAR